MTPELKNLLILLAGIAIALVIAILLFSGKSNFRKLMTMFLEDNGGDDGPAMPQRAVSRQQRGADEEPQKKTSEPIVEMATLVQKSDDRLRVIESSGQEHYEDEYYELVFVTRKGKKLRIECSAEAYGKVPFNQQGSLTYKRNKLVKFKYYEDTVFN
jgi:hypothetical protein